MNKNFNDLPGIMNSVSYHLKRIADELQVINDRNKAKDARDRIRAQSELPAGSNPEFGQRIGDIL